jgi:cyclopropane fatty-acyl-phospholipid synthase-like methyltransferase
VTGGSAGRRSASDGPPSAKGRALTPEAAYWDARYASDGKLWGDAPSELARLAVARLSFAAGRGFDLLDVGCGYGRDSLYLAGELGCRVVGLDPSPVAVAAARRGRRGDLDVEFEVADPGAFAGRAGQDGAFDVVLTSNVYHLLTVVARKEFAAAVVALTRPGGLAFLSTLSPRDPQHYAKGDPVPGEERSWIQHCYLHFCTEEELRADFAPLEVLDLEERSYEERHADDRVHHHTSWFLEARRPG